MNRPISVTLTLIVVLILTTWNLIRAWTLFTWQGILVEFSVRGVSEIIAVISIIWAITGFITIWGILQKKVWSKRVLVFLALSYTFWFWSERFIWQNSQTNTAFTVSVNIILLIIIYFAMREAYEQTNQTTE